MRSRNSTPLRGCLWWDRRRNSILFLKLRCTTDRRVVLQDIAGLRTGCLSPGSDLDGAPISQSRTRSQDPINQSAVVSYSSAFLMELATKAISFRYAGFISDITYLEALEVP